MGNRALQSTRATAGTRGTGLLMFFLALAAALTAASVAGIKRDPRRLSNALAVVAALVAWTLGGLSLLGHVNTRVAAVLLAVAALIVFLTVVGVAGAGAANGVLVIRREGLRPATVLPLAFVGVAAVSVAFVAAVFSILESHTLPLWFLAVFWTAVLFAVALAVQFIAFAVYALIYGRIEPPAGCAAIVALGCGLNADGSVTPLLSSRLDRAREVYAAEVATGHRPTLVVSGGQGTDESIAEATAMKTYLSAHGIDADHIIAETHSRTTHENLVLTKRLLESRALESEPMVVVTSDFHVLRTAAFTRDLGLDAHVTGARTARFYTPTAFLREFVAIVVRYGKANLALILGILAVIVLLQNVD
ncbi:MAG: YdcF family protein [Rhodococcus sp. (in: high G+C Gram-positive bacteria)]